MPSLDALDRTPLRRRLTGRDPEETHRVSTPLELLFDLTIVVAFGTASDELAHYVAEGHAAAGIAGFCFASFAVSWAWLNYTWFASAYDTDDWFFRLATMVQMLGVIVVSLGLPQMFASIDEGRRLDNGVLVAGYVVMRIALLVLWWQVMRHDPARAGVARTNLIFVGLSQVGWVVFALADVPLAPAFVVLVALIGLEFAGPLLASRKVAPPWHAHHIAERYGLLVIITLGEVIIGTVAALNAVVHGEAGWTFDAALLAFAGVGLTFGCWWMYFAIPWAEPLARHRERAFAFGYGHLLLFPPLAAMGAGLHVAAYQLEGEAEIGELATVLSVVIPIALYMTVFYGLYTALLRTRDALHPVLVACVGLVLGLTVVLAAVGVNMAVCLVVLAFAPAVAVLGYERIGRRRVAAAVARL